MMKKLFFALALVCALSLNAEVTREHRAIWMSPYLGSNWPSSAITEGTAQTHKNMLNNQLNKFKAQNVNVLYYHVRAMCDANYESSYEPWSKNVSGTRGTAPAFDPFAYLIEQAHLRGIEVYGWLNPYRYHGDKDGSWGEHELNYETSHPDWLISGNTSNRVLNPALEEVKQRIVDVCKEVVTKYDVDGIIFDDYFYPQGGTTEGSSAPDYAQYKASGTSMSMADWRRANVNEMLSRVYKMIKEEKPYVCFGVSPAGKASPPNIADYGLPAGPSGDWQYGQIYSDPVAWMNAGTLDFISPQVYWPTSNAYIPLTEWWANAAKHFNRHLYQSVNLEGDDGLTDLTTHGAQELIDELEYIRTYCDPNAGGIAYFQYKPFVNYSEKYDGSTRQKFGEIMASTICDTKVLTPLRMWNNVIDAKMTSNVKLSGTTLTWDAVDGVRYTVYAVPEDVTDAQFYCQKEYLDGISYTNSYTIPDDKASGYRWAVAVYDRYGNEYSPLFAGAAATTSSPVTLTFPVKGTKAPGLFEFEWSGDCSKAVVELSKDSSFKTILGIGECGGNKISSSKFPTLVEGETYYWRVRSSKPNASEAVSAAESFVYSRMAMTYPTAGATGVSATATFTWTEAGEGVEYLLEVSQTGSFTDSVHVVTVSKASYTIPDKVLSTGRGYSVRVTAMKDGASAMSDAVAFTTVDVTYTDAPVITYPAKTGATLYSNEAIRVNPWSGMSAVSVEICTSSSFPARSKKFVDLTNFAYETPTMGSGEWGTMTDGKTYYLRAYGKYYISTSSAQQKTGFSEVMTFVYNADTGIEDVTSDNASVYVNSNDVLVVSDGAAQVEIYTISGQMVESVAIDGDYDLKHLSTGVYVIKVATLVETVAVKYVR